eukprot:scaffold122816_cov35-Tisochrysis_lutea.AAC.2
MVAAAVVQSFAVHRKRAYEYLGLSGASGRPLVCRRLCHQSLYCSFATQTCCSRSGSTHNHYTLDMPPLSSVRRWGRPAEMAAARMVQTWATSSSVKHWSFGGPLPSGQIAYPAATFAERARLAH